MLLKRVQMVLWISLTHNVVLIFWMEMRRVEDTALELACQIRAK